MSTAFYTLFYSFGLVVFLLGIQSLIFFPLTILYEIWKRRALAKLTPFEGLVSVIVPAYNEEATLRTTLMTLMESDYPHLEIIVVNDGSTDQTEQSIADLIDSGRVAYYRQANAGKANALNLGISKANGEVILYTDADSLFQPDTVSLMARWFGDPGIDAVCGNDRPLYPQNALHRFLTVTTHIGTGFVRRALSVIGCLQIISGNLGAIRKTTLDEVGGFMNIWGEDLEITFRLHQFGKRIIFDPQPQVLAECPGTMRALWKQRVRWIRSYLKIVMHHRSLFFSRKCFPFSYYLPVNFLNMGIVPILQIALLAFFPFAYASGMIQIYSAVDILIYLGFFVFVLVAIYSILLDKAYQDIKQLPYGLLIMPISYFYNAVVIYSWWKELRRADETWHKSERRDLQLAQHMTRRQAVVATSFMMLSVSLISYLLIFKPDGNTLRISANTQAEIDLRPQYHLALSTHFDAWPDWQDAIKTVASRKMISKADIIGIGAGRTEWAYFRWKEHESDWSNHQRGESRDLMNVATNTFHEMGPRVAAMIDLYAPKYILQNPEDAAVRFDGEKSADQVGLVALTQGRYGQKVLSMIEYLANNYAVDIISLTEIPYSSYSYNAADLRSYQQFSGKPDWPRDISGNIDRRDDTVWLWKNKLMESFISEAAKVVHQHNKELYVDVPVSWDNFANEGQESALDYRRILKHADKIVLWNYFYLEGKRPEVSFDLSQYMANNFPENSYYISIGLWGNREHADAKSVGSAIRATLNGGGGRIWITPNDMVGEDHWTEILSSWVTNHK